LKILIINASPRKKGITTALLDELQTAINPSYNTDVVRIQDLKIKPCIGCLKCRPDKTCILPRDDAHILGEKVREADFLIIGSPVYWGNMPGPLKIFFDRSVPLFEYCEAKAIRYIPRPQLKNKRAVLIVSGGTPFPFNLMYSQSRGTLRSLKTILKSGGIKISSTLNVPDSYNFEKKRQRYLNKATRIAKSI
jgi:multimeric flavodoxin WrbA